MVYDCIIIDDDPSAVETLCKYLQFFPLFSIQNVYNDPALALTDMVANQSVACIFIDVNMPQISGLQLSKTLRSKTEKIIFCTAGPDFGFDAFEIGVDAYLLKPYTFVKFAKALGKLFPVTPEKQLRDFCLVEIEKDGLIKKIRISDIVYFESRSNFVLIHLLKNVFKIYQDLQVVYTMLQEQSNFIQISPSVVISQSHIKTIGIQQVEMAGGVHLAVDEGFKTNMSHFF